MNKFLTFFAIMLFAITVAMGVCSIRSNIDTQKTKIIKKTHPFYHVPYRNIFKDVRPMNGFVKGFLDKHGVGYEMAFRCELTFIQK